MEFLSSYHTDIGIKKSTNQDGLLIKVANTLIGKVGLFVICDGMGGLSQGELASSTVIMNIAKWFDEELPKLIKKNIIYDQITLSLNDCIKFSNDKITTFGNEKSTRLGSTITAMLFVKDKYVIAHVGDSRAYHISKELNQLTKDQTYIQMEVDRGNITKEEAKNHKKRNVLLQCVGVTYDIEILNYIGDIKKDTTYLLCSDGLYHKISNEEIINNLCAKKLNSENHMFEVTKALVELAKKRGEVDNISLILIKII